MGKTNAFLAPCSVLFVCLFILEEDEDEERKTLVASQWQRKETRRVLFVVVKDCGVSFAPSLLSPFTARCTCSNRRWNFSSFVTAVCISISNSLSLIQGWFQVVLGPLLVLCPFPLIILTDIERRWPTVQQQQQQQFITKTSRTGIELIAERRQEQRGFSSLPVVIQA